MSLGCLDYTGQVLHPQKSSPTSCEDAQDSPHKGEIHTNSYRCPSSIHEFYSPFLSTVGRVISFFLVGVSMGKCQVPQFSKTPAICLCSERCPCSAGPARKRAHPDSEKHIRPQMSDEQVRPTKLLTEHPHRLHGLHTSL